MRSSERSFVVRLMERFRVDEALIGDLIEQHHAGRPVLWLWQQALVALAKTAIDDVGRHHWFAVRAILVGWSLHALVSLCRRPAMLLMAGWSWKVDLWLTQTLFVYIPISFMVVEGVGAAAIGFIIARLNRPYGLSMVSLFVISMLIVDAIGFINSFQRGISAFGPVGLAINSAFPFIIVPVAFLTGACLASS
jgi:hypothetical protein